MIDHQEKADALKEIEDAIRNFDGEEFIEDAFNNDPSIQTRQQSLDVILNYVAKTWDRAFNLGYHKGYHDGIDPKHQSFLITKN